MTALIIATVLFNKYVREEHFRVCEVLPSKDCLKADLQYAELDLSFLKHAYLQEELRDKEAFPDDIPMELAASLGLEPPDEEEVEPSDFTDGSDDSGLVPVYMPVLPSFYNGGASSSSLSIVS